MIYCDFPNDWLIEFRIFSYPWSLGVSRKIARCSIFDKIIRFCNYGFLYYDKTWTNSWNVSLLPFSLWIFLQIHSLKLFYEKFKLSLKKSLKLYFQLKSKSGYQKCFLYNISVILTLPYTLKGSIEVQNFAQMQKKKIQNR